MKMDDIPALWRKFMTEQVSNKIDNSIYCIYIE